MLVTDIPVCVRPSGVPDRFIYRQNGKTAVVSYEPNGECLFHVDMPLKHRNIEVAVRNLDGMIEFHRTKA